MDKQIFMKTKIFVCDELPMKEKSVFQTFQFTINDLRVKSQQCILRQQKKHILVFMQ